MLFILLENIKDELNKRKRRKVGFIWLAVGERKKRKIKRTIKISKKVIQQNVLDHAVFTPLSEWRS
jgi:uncharacterized protein YegL